MKRTLLIRFLAGNDCTLYREGGRHSVYVNRKNAKKVAVPRHPEINDIFVKEICKALGIPYPGKN
ncbi:MAG: type II toxin-antitoxin system HicA family toxin [Bacteroidales bacterium]|nr:type II toxin-antitoxin system HicA family toxin [Bacteroidales bacterium]MBQ6741637.1 type II toxin-antitoxin system HicA family toxin [Bacteroidales bacterium]